MINRQRTKTQVKMGFRCGNNIVGITTASRIISGIFCIKPPVMAIFQMEGKTAIANQS